MAGLAELLLGKSNPLAQFVSGNQNKIHAAFGGFGTGTNFNEGLSNAAQAAAQASPLDQAIEQKRLEAEQQEEMQNKTVAYLRAQPGGAQFADAIEQGGMDGSLAFKGWIDASKGQDPTANMRDWQFAQQNPGYADFLNPPKDATSNQPASVQEYQFAKSQGYNKDYQTFLHEKTRNGGTPNATVMKEIFEADEGAQAGQNVLSALDRADQLNASAWDGPFADVRSAGAALFGNQDAVNTQELQNTVTANALESLRATFGGNPTEGERKILLEVQGSVNQPRAVREAIFARARAAAKRRLQFNEERARSLRGGEYFNEGYSPVGGAPAPNQTSTGVTWSIEP